MTFLDHIPALVRMTLVFMLVLYAIRKNLSLGNAFMIGAVVLSLFFAMPVTDTLGSILNAVVYPKTLSLAIVVSLILVLSSSMEITGRMKRLLDRFRGLIAAPRLNLIIFPALIGLLPMPGGAVFSAPMVKEMASGQPLTPSRLSFINYWFRHVWEYWWPMYPGVLLATLMADISLVLFVVMMCPLTVVAILSGGISKKELNPQNSPAGAKPSAKPFLHEMIPILIVIILGLMLGMLLSWFFPGLSIAKEVGLIVSLVLAVLWIWWENEMTFTQRRETVLNKKLFQIFYMVIAILVFKGILGDSGAVLGISDELMKIHIPLVLIAAALPFIVGVFTGITIAFVGSTFPILISLVNTQGEAAFMPAYIMVGLVCGFAGVLLSPLHLCLLLSNQYFEAELNAVYRYLWAPCIVMTCAALAYFWVLHWIM
ncbi:MAG: DUF401 family protein [Desulfobacterales bacterium]